MFIVRYYKCPFLFSRTAVYSQISQSLDFPKHNLLLTSLHKHPLSVAVLSPGELLADIPTGATWFWTHHTYRCFISLVVFVCTLLISTSVPAGLWESMEGLQKHLLDPRDYQINDLFLHLCCPFSSWLHLTRQILVFQLILVVWTHFPL